LDPVRPLGEQTLNSATTERREPRRSSGSACLGGLAVTRPLAAPRTAAIAPESLVEAPRAAEDAQDAAEADAAWDEPSQSIPLEQIEAGFGR
jgi:hypothetical protein